MQLRKYQEEIAENAVQILRERKIVYLTMEVRTGKTLTSLEIARLYGAKNVLFLTKKKAINNIHNDWIDFGYDKAFNMMIVNDESMHKIEMTNPDLVIHDEHHRFGGFPKPGKYTKMYRQMFSRKPMVFLSGTPTPESFSQIYHQFWVSDYSPFAMYPSFYKWANDYVNVYKKNINGLMVNDYSHGIESSIMKDVSRYMITFTQKAAGFTTSIDEEVITVDMSKVTQKLCNKLEKDLVIEGKEKVVLAETPAKLMQKLHQLWSGTVKFEDGSSMITDKTKAEFIKNRFSNNKIGIFYKFKEELNLLNETYGSDLTTDVEEFDTGNFKVIALQIVSGREGISLKNADYVVFYNIDFSATSYWQARDRMTTMERKFNKVYWIFSNGGIEEKIYKTVKSKKKYTTNIFKKDYGITD